MELAEQGCFTANAATGEQEKGDEAFTECGLGHFLATDLRDGNYFQLFFFSGNSISSLPKFHNLEEQS